MTSLRILLTGDDGYHSLGTRLLIHYLQKKYDLTICGTTAQQSGVGGKVSLKDGFNWAKTEVDGVKGYWVDGTPADAIEFAATLFRKPFDLVISGINWGANLGSGIFSSGTVSAALRAAGIDLAKHVIALSWDVPFEWYLKNHVKEESLEDYLSYPGKTVFTLIELAFSQQFWGADLLNINFPYRPTKRVRFTDFIPNIKNVYDYSGYRLDKKAGHYSYMTAQRIQKKNISSRYDVRALTDGDISITLCKRNVLYERIYTPLKDTRFTL
ncbi:hypothetical protein HY469_05215 [Candidatus Roizmanbacteria bacterium]|nr:hypothetical protein [Candidatus Roizmanbacteria bacterium]